jgi:hypothetical protein
MVRQLVLAVTGSLELEGAVFDVEVAREALTQLVQDPTAATICEGAFGDDNVRGKDRRSAGNRPSEHPERPIAMGAGGGAVRMPVAVSGAHQ